MQEKLRQSELDKLQLETDITQIRDQINYRKSEAEREARKKERMEKEMKELKQSLESRQFEIKQKQAQVLGNHRNLNEKAIRGEIFIVREFLRILNYQVCTAQPLVPMACVV